MFKRAQKFRCFVSSQFSFDKHKYKRTQNSVFIFAKQFFCALIIAKNINAINYLILYIWNGTRMSYSLKIFFDIPVLFVGKSLVTIPRGRGFHDVQGTTGTARRTCVKQSFTVITLNFSNRVGFRSI